MDRVEVAYLDQNVYSWLLGNNLSPFKERFAALPVRFAFSDVHLYEMRNRPADYARLLTELDAVFLRNPSAEHNIHARISCMSRATPRGDLPNIKSLAGYGTPSRPCWAPCITFAAANVTETCKTSRMKPRPPWLSIFCRVSPPRTPNCATRFASLSQAASRRVQMNWAG